MVYPPKVVASLIISLIRLRKEHRGTSQQTKLGAGEIAFGKADPSGLMGLGCLGDFARAVIQSAKDGASAVIRCEAPLDRCHACPQSKGWFH